MIFLSKSLLLMFHMVHLAIILFCMFGWIFPPARPWHLLLCVLIAASWFGLGVWKGWGYCLVTDIQWRLLRYMGEQWPPYGYVPLLWQRLSGRTPDAQRIDRMTETVFYICAAVSLWVNWSWLSGWV